MKAGHYSYMAEATAMLRAAHQVLDDDPKILLDPLVLTLLGDNTTETIIENQERHSSWYMKRARTLTLVRSRFTEDELTLAIGRGVTQYVILGAGLDTSPYRDGHPGQALATFEVDHPDTQRWKLDRLNDAGIKWRDNLRHIAVDFEQQSLLDGLNESGFNANEPAFFSWLGVTYYLNSDAVQNTFKEIAGCAPNSQLVFDFVLDENSLSDDQRIAVGRIADFVAAQGEPWLTRYEPSALQALLSDIGFSKALHFNQALATERYLADRQDGLSLDVAIQMMSAIV